MKIAIALPICGALFAAASITALAQQGEPKLLSRDEYRACLDTQDQLKARAAAVKVQIAKVNEESRAVKAEDDELMAERQRSEDSSFPGARDRFERKVRAHAQRGKAAEEAAKAANDEVAQINKDQDAYNARCGTVTVKPADRDAVMKEREAAGKK